jgi:hypothetical protein
VVNVIMLRKKSEISEPHGIICVTSVSIKYSFSTLRLELILPPFQDLGEKQMYRKCFGNIIDLIFIQ